MTVGVWQVAFGQVLSIYEDHEQALHVLRAAVNARPHHPQVRLQCVCLACLFVA